MNFKMPSAISQLPLSYENSVSNAPRDDSFASYLAVVRDNLTPEFSITPTPLHISLNRNRSDEDTEIDIFSAEKYFNASPTTPTAKPSPSTATLSKSVSMTWTFAGTTSVDSSQATTVNSRNVLLPDRRRRTAVGCGGSRLFHLGGLGLWCSSCSRKHAVSVNKSKESAASVGSNFVEQKQSNMLSPVSWRIEASSPATWPRRRQPKPTPPANEEDDGRSESSSDLFEIESVGMSRAAYEPSEASIAWSVVTASAANVSVASDRIGEIDKGRRKTAGILLAGCASHKAVEVGKSPAAAAAPEVARYHVDFDAGGGSGRIVAGRAKGTSWHAASARMKP